MVASSLAHRALMQTMLIVCDGHGPAGADASEGTISTILKVMESDPVLHDCRASGRDAVEQTLTKVIFDAETNVFLTNKKGKSSGTTFNLVILCGDEVAYTANVGDSRSCIAIESVPGKATSQDITVDHTVNRYMIHIFIYIYSCRCHYCCALQAATSPTERERVKKAGGKIRKFGGSHRVMSPGGECALAPTRRCNLMCCCRCRSTIEG